MRERAQALIQSILEEEVTELLGREKSERKRAVDAPDGYRNGYGKPRRNHPREVVEAALAHVVRNPVEAAYMRSDLFERRRRLMNDWATYLASENREFEAGSTG